MAVVANLRAVLAGAAQVSGSAPSTAGQPTGLLLILTKAS